MDLARGATKAVALGLLDARRAQAVLEGPDRAADCGEFIAVGPFHAAAGIVPAAGNERRVNDE